MVFNSLTYAYFLLTVWILHWCVPGRWRVSLLFLASLVFYCSWRWEYGLLLLFCIVANFYLAKIIGRSKELLAVTILFNLSILGYYKYLGFFTDTANAILALFGAGQFSVAAVLLPLGVSFFTFHAMSYVVDVYRGDRQPEPSLLRFMLYETFWPHLIAGPILRSHEIIPQFENPRVFRYEDMTYGARRILD